MQKYEVLEISDFGSRLKMFLIFSPFRSPILKGLKNFFGLKEYEKVLISVVLVNFAA